MTVFHRHAILAVIVVLAAAALLAPGSASATRFFGTVGPGFTITLERANGNTVHQVPHGRHTFVIRDRGTSHNFHLLGRGVNRETGVPFTGRRRWSVRLRVGTYRYRCDPHRMMMRGSFRVV